MPLIQKGLNIYREASKPPVVPLTYDLLEFNVWIWGEAGKGKTGWIYDFFGADNVYEKDKSKYWNLYEGQKVALIDDIE